MNLLHQALVGLLIVGSFFNLAGQVADSILVQQKKELESLYSHENEDMRHLISGIHHYSFYPTISGHPFWIEEWTRGSLQTRLYHYPSVLLRYDTYRDVLVFVFEKAYQNVILVNSDEVISFFMDGRTFIYVGRGEESSGMEEAGIDPGYFELLYNGLTRLLAKRQKTFRYTNDELHKEGEFSVKNRRYLVRDDQFFLIRKNKDLFRFVGPHKDKIATYMKERKIRISGMTDDQFGDLMSYYDSL